MARVRVVDPVEVAKIVLERHSFGVSAWLQMRDPEATAMARVVLAAADTTLKFKATEGCQVFGNEEAQDALTKAMVALDAALRGEEEISNVE